MISRKKFLKEKAADDASKTMRNQVINDFNGEVTRVSMDKRYQRAKGTKESIKPKPEGVKSGKELIKDSTSSNVKVNKEKLSKRLAEWAKKK